MGSLGLRCQRCFGRGHLRSGVGSLMYWGAHALGAWMALPTGGTALLFNLGAYLLLREPCGPCGGTGLRDQVLHQ